MKVTIIGSGSMWNENNSASYLIDDNILVDVPNGTCKNMFRLNLEPRNIENVLITHFHGDHFFDLPFYFILKNKTDSKLINLFCSSCGKKKIKKLFKLAFPNSLKDVYSSLNLKYFFDNHFIINNYEVNKYFVDHGRMKPAYGYIFSNNNINVGFTGDTSLCDTIEMMASKCSYLFCDCMFIKGTSKHMGIDNLIYLTNKYPDCKFVVSHLENDTRMELKKKNIENIIVPNDGMIINI